MWDYRVLRMLPPFEVSRLYAGYVEKRIWSWEKQGRVTVLEGMVEVHHEGNKQAASHVTAGLQIYSEPGELSQPAQFTNVHFEGLGDIVNLGL